MHMQDLIGQQLGNYRLTALLGKGGFARVYLGEHIFLGSQARAAIKVLTATKLNDEDRQKFISEARIIRKLNHPHIVKLLEFGIELSRQVDDSTPYLVMDYAPDGTLRDHHPRTTTIPIQQIVSYVDQVAAGLQYAHDQGTIHRDVKPENMLVMGANEIVLSDFGIAVTNFDSKNYEAQKDGVLQGTFAYIAPERFRDTTRRASDQYSLGIVVYEWLAGSSPFKGPAEQIIYDHIHTAPPPLYGVYPHVSQEVEAVVMKALAKEPEQRYPSVKDFAQALSAAAQGGSQAFTLPAEPSYARQPEPKISQEPPAEQPPRVNHQPHTEVGTQEANSEDYLNDLTQRANSQAYAKQYNTDADEHLQQAKQQAKKRANTDKLVMTDPGQQKQADAASQPQERPARTSEPAQNHAAQQQQAPQDQTQLASWTQAPQDQTQPAREQRAYTQQQGYPDYQTWQQIMEYRVAKTARPTANLNATSEQAAARQPKKSPARSRKKTFVETLRGWFELDHDFARIPKNRMFRTIGTIVDVLAAVAIGVFAQPPSGWLLFWALLYSLILFNLCIRLVNVTLSMLAGLLVAAYWGYATITLWHAIDLYGPYMPKVSPFLIAFLPPSLVALFIFSASAYVHIRYVMNRLP